MNFKRTFQILSKDIEEIEKILGEIEISSPEGEMEKKLALSKLKNLQENFGLFGTLLEEVAVATPPPPATDAEKRKNTAPGEKDPAGREVSVTREDTPPAPEAVHEEAPSPPVAEESSVEEEEKAEEKHVTAEKIPVSEEMHKEMKADKPGEKAGTPRPGKGKKVIFSDTLQPQHGYRNEQLARENTGDDLSSKLSKRAVSDLRKIINLNEKFMFIRDLFDGDKGRYEETIRFINKAASRREADEFLAGFKWDKKSEAAKRFHELVQRKLKSLRDG